VRAGGDEIGRGVVDAAASGEVPATRGDVVEVSSVVRGAATVGGGSGFDLDAAVYAGGAVAVYDLSSFLGSNPACHLENLRQE
jgi:hypothetical protein